MLASCWYAKWLSIVVAIPTFSTRIIYPSNGQPLVNSLNLVGVALYLQWGRRIQNRGSRQPSLVSPYLRFGYMPFVPHDPLHAGQLYYYRIYQGFRCRLSMAKDLDPARPTPRRISGTPANFSGLTARQDPLNLAGYPHY